MPTLGRVVAEAPHGVHVQLVKLTPPACCWLLLANTPGPAEEHRTHAGRRRCRETVPDGLKAAVFREGAGSRGDRCAIFGHLLSVVTPPTQNTDELLKC